MREETRKLLHESIASCLRTLDCRPGDGFCVGLGVSDDIIKGMEDELGLKFSDDYIEFLRCYGETSISSYRIYGYSVSVPMHGEGSTVVSQTSYYRVFQEWPGIADWYIVSEDFCGNPIGCKPDGSVWISDHDAGFEEEKMGDSFDDFLYNLLLEEKELEQEGE